MLFSSALSPSRKPPDVVLSRPADGVPGAELGLLRSESDRTTFVSRDAATGRRSITAVATVHYPINHVASP